VNEIRLCTTLTRCAENIRDVALKFYALVIMIMSIWTMQMLMYIINLAGTDWLASK